MIDMWRFIIKYILHFCIYLKFFHNKMGFKKWNHAWNRKFKYFILDKLRGHTGIIGTCLFWSLSYTSLPVPLQELRVMILLCIFFRGPQTCGVWFPYQGPVSTNALGQTYGTGKHLISKFKCLLALFYSSYYQIM